MTRSAIGGVFGVALWVWFGVRSWRRAQRDRAANHEPRSTRDDAWLLLSAIIVGVMVCVTVLGGFSENVSMALLLATVVLVFFLFHRAGQSSRSHNER